MSMKFMTIGKGDRGPRSHVLRAVQGGVREHLRPATALLVRYLTRAFPCVRVPASFQRSPSRATQTYSPRPPGPTIEGPVNPGLLVRVHELEHAPEINLSQGLMSAREGRGLEVQQTGSTTRPRTLSRTRRKRWCGQNCPSWSGKSSSDQSPEMSAVGDNQRQIGLCLSECLRP